MLAEEGLLMEEAARRQQALGNCLPSDAAWHTRVRTHTTRSGPLGTNHGHGWRGWKGRS